MAHMNSLTASCSHLKAYQRCNQPTSKVSIIREYSKKFFKGKALGTRLLMIGFGFLKPSSTVL